MPSCVVTLGGRPYLKTVGRTQSVEGCVITLYDFTDGTDTATLYYIYEGDALNATHDAAADKFVEESMIFNKVADR